MKKVQLSRPVALSIAGFDPSGGAGVIADVKTFESHGVYGLSVCTGITVQNDISFEAVDWTSLEFIIQQIDILLQRFNLTFVKIGLIENLDILLQVVRHLKSKRADILIIWDPIFSASAGFEFHKKVEADVLQVLCRDIYLLTPNLSEFDLLFAPLSPEDAVRKFDCNILLKGGHGQGDTSVDVLFQTDSSIHKIEQPRAKLDKHGTGCVLSAAIAANLAKGHNLLTACTLAQKYIFDFINSNESLLGFHDYSKKKT